METQQQDSILDSITKKSKTKKHSNNSQNESKERGDSVELGLDSVQKRLGKTNCSNKTGEKRRRNQTTTDPSRTQLKLGNHKTKLGDSIYIELVRSKVS